MADETLSKQAAERIATVRKAHKDAGARLLSKMWPSAATTAALNGLASLGKSIDGWAKRGSDAAAGGKPLAAGGWPGWVKAGDVFLEGIAEQLQEGEHATLADIRQTLADAKADAKRVATKAATTVASAAKVAAGEVAEVAAEAAKPLTVPLMFVAIGLVAVALIVWRR